MISRRVADHAALPDRLALRLISSGPFGLGAGGHCDLHVPVAPDPHRRTVADYFDHGGRFSFLQFFKFLPMDGKGVTLEVWGVFSNAARRGRLCVMALKCFNGRVVSAEVFL